MPKALIRLATGVALMALLLVNWAAAQDASLATPAQEEQAAPPAAPVDEKAPPLPFHGIEGVGGGAITPMAYLVNPGKPGCLWGKPAVAAAILNGGGKDLQALTISETLFGRVEFSYGIDRLGLGSLPRDIDTYTPFGVIEESGVWLHNFNVRTLLVKENDCLFGIKAPAITAGVSFKYNGQIENIDQELSGALTDIGYRRSNGTDFTLTMTKTFPTLAFGRPVVMSAGGRLSEAAQIGFLGFGDQYHATFEGNIAYLPFDRIVLAYEFRQKHDPYGVIPNGDGGYLIGPENNWNAFDLGIILNRHTTLVGGWALLGNLANQEANNALFVQLKHEW